MRDINNYQERYNTSNFEDYQIVYRRRKILEIMGGVEHDSILEIGVGMCPIFNYFDEYKAYFFYEPGCDFYANAMELSKDNKRIKGFNVSFECDKNIDGEQLDFIICASILHEVESPMSLLHEIYKCTRKNTHVLINVPNANSFHRLLAMKIGLINDVKDFSERNIFYQQHSVFDMNELVKLVNEVGFKVEDSGYIFIKPFTHGQMYKMIQNHIIDERVLDGLYDMTEMYPELGSEIWLLCQREE